MKSTVYVLWSNGKISKYEFDNSGSNLKYRWQKYCKNINSKGGRVLDPNDPVDYIMIENSKTTPN